MPANLPPDNSWIQTPEVLTAIMSALGGLVGRLMALSQERRPVLSWALLWEVPIALGMGWIARGLAEYLNIWGFTAFSMCIVAGLMGPRVVSNLVQYIIDRVIKK